MPDRPFSRFPVPELDEEFRFGVWDGANPVTKEPDGKGPGPDGAYALCPAFLTDEEISEKGRVLSKTFFSAQYLCEPVPSEEALFDLDLVHAATDESLSLDKLPDGPEILLYDPVARIDGAKGDLNGLVVVRVIPAGQLGLRGFPKDRNIFFPVFAKEIAGGADAAACWIEDVACHQFKKNLKSIWIEQVASQSLFAPWLEERKKIQGVKIRGQKIGNASLPYRLMSLQTAMRKGYLVLPKDFPGRELLVQRLIEYPLSDSDDLISALALLSTMVERRGQLPGVPAPELGAYPTRIWNSQTSRRNDYWG